jgi:hypothetical protein
MSTWIINARGDFIRTDYLVSYKNRNNISEYRGFTLIDDADRRMLEATMSMNIRRSFESPVEYTCEWRTNNGDYN